MWVSANAMLSVPSVTMKAGSRTCVTSPPFSMPKPMQVRMPIRIAGIAGHAARHGKLGHHDLPERHDGPDRQVDSGGQDHERLTDREHADDHRLLQHEREVLGLQEPVRLQREERHREHEGEERAPPSAPSSHRRAACRAAIDRLRVPAVAESVVVTSPPEGWTRSYGLPDATATGASCRPGRGSAGGSPTPSSWRGRRRRSWRKRRHGRLRDQVDAGVGVAGDLLPALRVVDDRLDAPATPSAADTAARSRRSLRP